MSSLFADESKGIDIQVAKLSVVRLRGAFGAVTARWSVVGNDTNDLSPLYGTLTFTEAQTSAVIQIQSVPDEVRTYKYLWKSSKPCRIDVYWIALTEYPQMSTQMSGFQWFFRDQISYQQHKG